MASSEVSWQSAFWGIVPIALNSMAQPSGRVCGFHPSLRTYIRSSPIVCGCDAVIMIIRFITYNYHGLSPPSAAKKVLTERNKDLETPQTEGIQSLEKLPFLRWFFFVFGVLPQVIKLLACSGIPWTQISACLYLASFLVTEALKAIAKFAEEEGPDDFENERLEKWENLLSICEKCFGALAVLLQMSVLALVDLARIPIDPDPLRRWRFRTLRFSAHLLTLFIYFPLVFWPTSSARFLTHQTRNLLILMLLVVTLLTLLHGFNLRFSLMYFMCSFILSMFSWVLFHFSATRTHILLCKQETKEPRNVVVFDFFCKILLFSGFWYVWCYNPAGTFKPKWAENLG